MLINYLENQNDAPKYITSGVLLLLYLDEVLLLYFILKLVKEKRGPKL